MDVYDEVDRRETDSIWNSVHMKVYIIETERKNNSIIIVFTNENIEICNTRCMYVVTTVVEYAAKHSNKNYLFYFLTKM